MSMSAPFGSSSPSPLGSSTTPAKKSASSVVPQRIKPALVIVGGFGLVLVVVQLVNALLGYDLVAYGIEPRSSSGLVGILTAPLIHASWQHLFANLVPLLVLGFLIMVGGLKQFVAVTAVVWLVSGLGVWLISPGNTDTVGASGLVFGWLAFLVARGIFTRTWQHILIGLVLLAVWGGIFFTGIVQLAVADIGGVVTVSWQGHLFGAIGGVLAAALVAGADRSRRSARPVVGR